MNRRFAAVAALIIVVALFAALLENYFKNPTVPTFASEYSKDIYLTFEDGPIYKVTPNIMDILKEEKIQATFFIVGSQAEKRRDIVKRIFDEGHSVGVHSYSHKYDEVYSSPEKLIEDLEKCNDVICRITGEYANIYRFPGGSFNVKKEFTDSVKKEGYKFVDWNASFRDCELKDATSENLYSAAVSTAADKSRIVMLAHDTSDKLTTVGALKKVIRYFKSRGYNFKKF